ncbi:MAG: alpha-ketoglutarate-dependent dioxygenase AlkB [Chitinophagaceae bacterium]|nr:alpha-ketoglutarate-dependent dioxygenase AlkB [Chitinophagaceae bacterium]
MEHFENLLPFSGEAYYFPAVFAQTEREKYFNSLCDEIKWKQEPIKLFGKEIMQPRLTAWYGDPGKPYTYSGTTMQPMEWTKDLLEIKLAVEKLSHVHFTSALLNLYRDGKDSMGWHRDNEKMLGPAPVIASASFGGERTFQFRNYTDKSIARSIDLQPGSILIMRGATQQHWEHRIPKTTRISNTRINITFRII